MAGVTAGASPLFDVILRGGRVIDPACGRDGVADVGIRGERIARVEERLDPRLAAHVVDVSGLIVTPGLIDIHTHTYISRQRDDPSSWLGSLNADAQFLPFGVTTAVDTGTAGADEIDHFRPRSRILSDSCWGDLPTL